MAYTTKIGTVVGNTNTGTTYVVREVLGYDDSVIEPLVHRPSRGIPLHKDDDPYSVSVRIIRALRKRAASSGNPNPIEGLSAGDILGLLTLRLLSVTDGAVTEWGYADEELRRKIVTWVYRWVHKYAQTLRNPTILRIKAKRAQIPNKPLTGVFYIEGTERQQEALGRAYARYHAALQSGRGWLDALRDIHRVRKWISDNQLQISFMKTGRVAKRPVAYDICRGRVDRPNPEQNPLSAAIADEERRLFRLYAGEYSRLWRLRGSQSVRDARQRCLESVRALKRIRSAIADRRRLTHEPWKPPAGETPSPRTEPYPVAGRYMFRVETGGEVYRYFPQPEQIQYRGDGYRNTGYSYPVFREPPIRGPQRTPVEPPTRGKPLDAVKHGIRYRVEYFHPDPAPPLGRAKNLLRS